MRRWPVVVLVVAFVVFVAVACTTRGNFDGWIARSGYHVAYVPVPCDRFPANCHGSGQVDVVTRTVYIDPNAVAVLQDAQNRIDPTVSVMTQVYYHEWGHVADVAVGFIEGTNPVQLEHVAQCVMQLITGRSFTGAGLDPTIYWTCPDFEVAKVRWILTAKGII